MIILKNVMCLINVCMKMENPDNFTLNYAANNITYYRMFIYLYSHWKLRSIFLWKYALLNIY